MTEVPFKKDDIIIVPKNPDGFYTRGGPARVIECDAKYVRYQYMDTPDLAINPSMPKRYWKFLKKVEEITLDREIEEAFI